MNNRVGNIAITVCFMLITCGFMLAHLILPDRELSKSERRRLLSFPPLQAVGLFSGDYLQRTEKYLLDQFALRDTFRTIKAYSVYFLFAQKDNNHIYLLDDYIVKIEYPLREKAIFNAADKFNEIYTKYLQGKNVHYAIIPDKNYFAAPVRGHLAMDYSRLLEIMRENVRSIQYIDIFSVLALDDYYRTDIHWRQERLPQVADKLLMELGNTARVTGTPYILRELPGFYGSYYGQAAILLQPDTLTFLSSKLLDEAMVFDHAAKSDGKIYNPDAFFGMDPYDVFLTGAQPLLTIYNPENTDGRELLLFRDSFGSSIAPLLLPGYSKITLIDLRYISSKILADYIDFTQDQDVLFLYSTTILNNSYMLK